MIRNVVVGRLKPLVDDAYRIYDADPEHNRIRQEMIAPFSVLVERVQFRLP